MSFQKDRPDFSADLNLNKDMKSIDSPFDEFSRNPWVKILFLPGCLLFAIGLESFTLVKIVSFGFTHWFHELGHALFAWLSGRASLPILGLAITSSEKSVFTAISFLFLIVFMGYSGFRYKSPYLLFIAASLFIAQFFYTFVSTYDFWEMSMIYGGVGGEFILAALVISASCHRIPEQTYWDLLRFIVVPWSVVSFWQSFSRWIRILNNEEMIPWGTMWGGADDSNGDMNRLHSQFDFSRGDLAHAYIVTAFICCAFIMINFLWFAWPAIIEILRKQKLKS
ncbi:MAG: hypothetical protein JWQ35_804 [Bacteriovoracaceae bacterium]|nr:hypothetical protein [Bacteriovoracaceae bacterium]